MTVVAYGFRNEVLSHVKSVIYYYNSWQEVTMNTVPLGNEYFIHHVYVRRVWDVEAGYDGGWYTEGGFCGSLKNFATP